MISVDVTELVQNPVRTGIQRVVRELLKGVTSRQEFRATYFDPSIGHLREIPEAVTEWLLETTPESQASTASQVGATVAEILAIDRGDPLDPRSVQSFYIPEVFFCPVRAGYYKWVCETRASSVYMLVYDMIPWLHPELIGVETTAALMPYLQLTTQVGHVAFISEKTRADWEQRITKGLRCGGPVLSLGADGVIAEKQVFRTDRRTYLCVGSIDERKNQHILVQAFEKLWSEGSDARLVIVGRAFDENSDVAKIVRRAEARSHFEYYSAANDIELQGLFSNARALVYISSVEGFGLPPVESLYCGVPVIVTESVPSTAMLPPLGQIKIKMPEIDLVVKALQEMENDTIARRLWSEVSGLDHSTWGEFCQENVNWLKRAS